MPGGLCLFMEQVQRLVGTVQLLDRPAGAPAETQYSCLMLQKQRPYTFIKWEAVCM
jgi:hypothetical protein